MRHPGVLLPLALMLPACAHASPPPAVPAPPAITLPVPLPAPAVAASVAPPAPSPPLADLEVAANRAFFAALNAHDPKALASLYVPDATVFVGVGLSEAHGAEAVGKMAQVLWDAFPDSKAQWSRLLQSGKAVAVELAWTGTNIGALRDHAPTKKIAGVDALLVEKFDAGGRIAEQHIYVDADGLAVLAGWRPGKARRFDGLPTSQETVLERAVASPDDDGAMRRTAADFLHGAFKDAIPLGGDKSTWTDESTGRVMTGKNAVASWLTFLSHAFPGGGRQLLDVWSTGELVVEEWSSSSGGPPDPAANHAADVVLFDGGKISEVRTYRNTPHK